MDDLSLYSNLKGSIIALRQLGLSNPTAHPVVKNLLKSLDQQIFTCLNVCQGDAKKLYPYIFDILNKIDTTHHSRLSLYYSHSPYWQHYIANMIDIIHVLSACCCHRTTDGHASIAFHRKFQPFSAVVVRKPVEPGSRVWTANTVPVEGGRLLGHA